MTLIIGSQSGPTGREGHNRLDLRSRAPRPFAFFIPSITPLHDTRMELKKGVRARAAPLQWQLMMKCWKMNLRP
jgi:hypothetical protein